MPQLLKMNHLGDRADSAVQPNATKLFAVVHDVHVFVWDYVTITNWSHETKSPVTMAQLPHCDGVAFQARQLRTLPVRHE